MLYAVSQVDEKNIMNRKIKVLLFCLLIIAHVVINRHIDTIKINIDLLFLILAYVAVKSSFLKCILVAMAIGLVTDFFSGGILGVFGFSRTLAAYVIAELSRYLDLRKNIFLFLLIALSLFMSNMIANLFFYFILDAQLNITMVVYSPLVTAFIGSLIINLPKMKQDLDVY